MGILGFISIAAIWADFFFPVRSVEAVAFVVLSIFLFTITIFLIIHVAVSKDVNANIIFSAINGYLLLGIIGGISLALLDALTNTPILSNVQPNTLADKMYFSFVTLTTLGYGDLTPISHGSRVIASLLAVIGQLYIAILIAMLVGKFLNNPKQSKF
jgi:hypothetical protein